MIEQAPGDHHAALHVAASCLTVENLSYGGCGGLADLPKRDTRRGHASGQVRCCLICALQQEQGDARDDQDFKHCGNRMVSGDGQNFGRKCTEKLHAHAENRCHQGDLHDVGHHLAKSAFKPLADDREHQHSDEEQANAKHEGEHDLRNDHHCSCPNGNDERGGVDDNSRRTCHMHSCSVMSAATPALQPT